MKKQTQAIVGVFLFCFCGLATAGAFEQQIVLGREDGWRDFPRVENLVRRTGLWGSLDFFLQENEYRSGPETDLLLHFNQSPVEEASGHYRVAAGKVHASEKLSVLGGGSGGFSGARQGLQLRPLPGALFARATWWEDFSIEFWLFPSLLNDGEAILNWAGSRWQGERSAPQELRCTVQSRRLVWEFSNFFAGRAKESRFVLRGLTPLVPRKWHHHLIRFHSASGLLEYLVDGTPEAVLYAREGQVPQATVLLPYTGEADSAPLFVGRGFTGFLDELRISRAFVDAPVLSRYGDRTGTAVSRTFDLGYTGTRLKRIEAVYRKDSDTDVFFFYRSSDQWTAEELAGPWKQFQAGQSLGEVRGRYVQVMVELFPDGRRSASPQLSELRIVYEQDLPPAAPAGFYAVAGSAHVRLSWNAVREDDVRGYMIYYGYAPGNYHGTDSNRGASPIDAGLVSEFAVTGLENGRLYYFSVVAYDSTDPPHRSLFSKEVSARPSGALP